jgi:hypothetical protein
MGVLKKKMSVSSTEIRTPDRPAQSLVNEPTAIPGQKKMKMLGKLHLPG